MYRRLKTPLKRAKALEYHSDSEQMLMTPSGSSIFYLSGKVLEDLRGETLNGAGVDEYRNQHKDLWSLVVQPMLSTTKGWGAFLSTPNGYDHFYDLYEFAKQNPDDWAVFNFPSTINPLFDLEAYESARRNMPDKQFRQEILAEFLDLTAGKAYYAFSDQNVTDERWWGTPPDTWIDPNKPLVIGMDFNLNPMSWTLGQTNFQKWFWGKEIYLENSNTVEASLALCDLLSDYRNRGWLRSDPQLLIVGDAAGKASQRAAASKSDYDIVLGMLRERGFSFDDRTPEANPLVKDRINAVNAKLRTADGTILTRISPTGCPRLVKDLQRVVWKEGQMILDKTKDPTLTHSSDSIGYPIHRLTPIQEVKEVGKPVVVVY